jgi:hypothetical protein
MMGIWGRKFSTPGAIFRTAGDNCQEAIFEKRRRPLLLSREPVGSQEPVSPTVTTEAGSTFTPGPMVEEIATR